MRTFKVCFLAELTTYHDDSSQNPQVGSLLESAGVNHRSHSPLVTIGGACSALEGKSAGWAERRRDVERTNQKSSCVDQAWHGTARHARHTSGVRRTRKTSEGSRRGNKRCTRYVCRLAYKSSREQARLLKALRRLLLSATASGLLAKARALHDFYVLAQDSGTNIIP